MYSWSNTTDKRQRDRWPTYDRQKTDDRQTDRQTDDRQTDNRQVYTSK